MSLLATLGITLFSVGASTGVRFVLGTSSDDVTILVRIILPVLIAMPIALMVFSWIERMEASYARLMREANDLLRAASTDPLTGLLNRRSFEARFEAALALTSGGQFLIADVDWLKSINDQFGHIVGDDAILATATALTRVLEGDALIARIGGDEFCAFLGHCADCRVDELARQINAAADQEFRRRSGISDFSLSISVGLQSCAAGTSFREMMAGADSELYRKKNRRSPAELTQPAARSLREA